MDIERIGEPHEQVEQGAVVDGLGDLRVGPSHVPKGLNLIVGDSIRVPGQRADEFKQQALSWRHRRAVQITVTQRFHDFSVLLTLQLQEPCVAAESIVTPVQRRHV